MRRTWALLLVAACGAPAPRPLAYDSEPCTHCRMTLTDRRFGAELVLATGRVIPFDDAGCLATYLIREALGDQRVHSIWVTNFLPPHELLDVREARFVLSDSIHTPMDFGFAPVRSGFGADSLRAAVRGSFLRWDEVEALIRDRGAP